MESASSQVLQGQLVAGRHTMAGEEPSLMAEVRMMAVDAMMVAVAEARAMAHERYVWRGCYVCHHAHAHPVDYQVHPGRGEQVLSGSGVRPITKDRRRSRDA